MRLIAVPGIAGGVVAALLVVPVAPAIAAPALATGAGVRTGVATVAADSIVTAARALAEAQRDLAALRDRIPEQEALIASTGATAAQTAVTARSAGATARAARREAALAARTAQRATQREQVLAARSEQAAGDVKRLAREIYINGAGSSELVVFVGFASDGPSAFSSFARRDIALNNAGGITLVRADRAASRAAAAATAAEQARNEHEAAAGRSRDARAAFVAARRARNEAQRALTTAERQLAAAEKGLVRAAARFRTAQEAYEDALSSGPAGLPASPGNQGPVVWGMLIAAGYSEEATAGILGNLQQESNIDPTTIQNGGPGRGLAQWSQGGRWDSGPNSLLAFAESNDMKPWNVVTQVRFMIYEMEDVITEFDDERFKQMDDVLEATVYFHDVFERSADSAGFVTSVRGGYAQSWYDALAGEG